MLILSRALSEKVVIGKDVVISVLAINNKQVRLGFEAPKEIEINREEVFKKREEQKKHEKPS